MFCNNVAKKQLHQMKELYIGQYIYLFNIIEF